MPCSRKLFRKIIRHTWRIIFLSVLLTPSFPLLSQNYYFDSFGVADGLAQSTVYDIVQDWNDNLWLGTRAGVSKFDGKTFINYTIQNGIAENGVRKLFIDKDKNIWMAHLGGGVSIFNGRSFRAFSATNKFFKSDITAITQDHNGNIWITSELSGVVKISTVNNTLEESTFEHYIGNTLSDRIFGAYVSGNGTVYFMTDAFIKFYQPETNTFANLALEGMPSFFLITTMFEDSRNNLWFGTYNGGLYEYQSDKKTFKIYDKRDGLAHNWISILTEDANGKIWVGTWGGGITRITGDKLMVFDINNGLSDLKIRCIKEDAEGNILIGTEEHGLSIFKGDQFVTFLEEDGLLNNQVRAVIQDNTGDFWFGTSEGISIYNENKQGKQFTDLEKLKGKRVKMLREDSGGRVWIVTELDGIFTYNGKNRQYYEPKLNYYFSKGDNKVTCITADKKGLIWLGTFEGLVSYDFDDKTINNYTQTSGLAGNDITAVYADKNDRLWVGARGFGITFLQNSVFKILKLEQNFTPTCMILDEKGMLWVGTEAHGIFVIDPEKSVITRNITENDGLLANLVNLINADNNNNIYIGTNKGLNVYSHADNMIYAYTRKNGFVGIETNLNSTFRDRSGRLWFGTIAGITRYDPSLTVKSSQEPLTHITGMTVNVKDQPMTENLKLRYNQNNLVINYNSICLKNPETVKYRIMLEGADGDWRTTTETNATYPALAPKKYIFRVMAQNSDGIWNKEPISYSFQIRPPFYKTWWFIMIWIIIGAASIITYIRLRTQSLIREKKILEEKVAERTVQIVKQKEELAEKNKDITDSIRYAKRIQIAILPPEIPFKDTFILFKPKDIVSGDFYWLDKIGDLEFLAAVDCTGHGVPGAFMSLIGYTSISKIVREMKIYKPSDILNELNKEIIRSLQKQDEKGGNIQDGMDMSLICYNTRTHILEFAGAFNPLWVVRGHTLEEIKADRYSIGRSSADIVKEFTNHEIQVNKNDSLYFFSDGYADQFGGTSGKKFMTKPMKELIISIHEQPAERQKAILDSTLEVWRGDIEQVDDVLVIGRRF